jgi:NAD(P) transhydrogenase
VGDVDLLVIGCGPAGEKAAVQAAHFGKRVVVVEQAPEPGGTAVHTGTLPSKTLREAGLFLAGHRQRELYGVAVHVDRTQAIPKLLSSKNAVRDREVRRIRDNLARHRVPLAHGTARIVDPHTVDVVTGNGDTTRLTADVIVVATGSRPHRPATIDFATAVIQDADEIVLLDRLPRTLTVLGAGVIGWEYATMFAATGAAVTLVDPRPAVLSFLDDEIAERLRAGAEALGLHLRLGVEWETVVPKDDGVVVTLADGTRLESEQLLFAAGRDGNTDGLGLQALGVQVDERGQVRVDADFRTSVPSIYAVGDVIGFPALASTSMEQGRVAACHAFGVPYKQHVSALLPFGVYTIPEVSCVGLAELEARRRGHEVVVGRARFCDNARGAIIGDSEGVLKLVFDRATRRLLGCHCVGERATELVHVGQAIMLLGGTIETFIEMVFNFPTLSELYKDAAYDALGRLTA